MVKNSLILSVLICAIILFFVKTDLHSKNLGSPIAFFLVAGLLIRLIFHYTDKSK
jgi:hypothetical protein